MRCWQKAHVFNTAQVDYDGTATDQAVLQIAD